METIKRLSRNLTTRVGSDLSDVSLLQPLFDCYVRTISLDNLRLTRLSPGLTVSKTDPDFYRPSQTKQKESGGLNITNDND